MQSYCYIGVCLPYLNMNNDLEELKDCWMIKTDKCIKAHGIKVIKIKKIE